MIHQEKYLTYLPHSGFHNQRIALENAIFLSWFLNRTLIIPPLLMYKNRALIPRKEFNKLYNDLSKLKVCENSGQEICKPEPYIRYNWKELMDFTFLNQNIKYTYRQDFNYSHLIESLHIKNDNEVHNITYDREQYCDYSLSTKNAFDCVNLVELSKRPEKLLHFGSLFSDLKIIAKLPKNANFQNKLRQMLLPNNPTILSIVNNIVNKIGGTDNFIGVHARLGDGHFSRHQDITIQNLVETIQNDFKNIDDYNPYLSTKIFLATDIKNSESLQLFFQTFPYVYILDDFDDLLEPLKSLKNPIDGKIMYEFLVPFVDLLVVSRGKKFYRTYSSTFSKYAQLLNRIWLENELE
ncbi:ciga protein [Gigaspora margarita]|uniref:Ciga protein n=3 Tax=Gigaspora margarita TaxID=4874 RepID=A0A8H4AAI6_GIGMA|nr:ciga protein [Gigaspora margarita]